MRNQYREFEGMSTRDIQWRLRNRGLPEPLIDKMIEGISTERKEKGNASRAKRVHTKAWRELFAVLQHERKIVRSMVRYKTATPAPERDDLVDAYFAVLNKLHDKLVALRYRGGMPEHSHWVDYVPQRIQDALIDAAAIIPPRHKAKLKEPFQRTSPTIMHNLRHARLLRKTEKERSTLLIRLETNSDNDQVHIKLKRIDTAIKRIKAMEDNAHVPDHWASMVPDLFDTPQEDEARRKNPWDTVSHEEYGPAAQP